MTDDPNQSTSKKAERSGGIEYPRLDESDEAEFSINIEDLTFEAPWQARVFSIAVVLSDHREGIYLWKDFQEILADEIQSAADVEEDHDGYGEPSSGIDGSEAEYYERWLRALERIVFNKGLVDADEVRQRIQEFAEGDRDASEFVEGELDHTHPHSDSLAHLYDNDSSEDRTDRQ